MAVPSGITAVQLPPEVWLLIAQELTSGHDFVSLFNLSRVNKTMASIALPRLYSIQELSPASTGDTAVVDTKRWAVLWRSIVASSLGGTMYPYCLWIKSLSLGNLHSLLEDLARDVYKEFRDSFFAPPLERFQIFVTQGGHVETRRKRARLAFDNIVFAAADQITTFIRTAATEADTTIGLTSLEGYYMPSTKLEGWVPRLSLLRSLAVRDGSVLNSGVAEVIRSNCPQFEELMCHYCAGPDVDESLSGFIRGLSPNTLTSFTIMSHNRVGSLVYTALGHHSTSLRQLSLNIEDSAVAELPCLSECTNLVDLTLDVSATLALDWEATHEQEKRGIVSWLQQCSSLTKLSVANLPTPKILAEVLAASGVNLVELYIAVKTSAGDAGPFSEALGRQTGLTTFVFRSYDGYGGSDIVSAICQCRKLRKLNLVTQMLKTEDLSELVLTLKEVEEFAFDIDSDDPIGDEYILALAALPRLKTLNINANTSFTYKGLLAFFDNLTEHPADSHQGISVHIMRQVGTEKFADRQMRELNAKFAKQFGGRIEATYDRDPDELNESDFSD